MLTARTAGHCLFSSGTSPAPPDASYRANVVPPRLLGDGKRDPRLGGLARRVIAAKLASWASLMKHAPFQFFLALLSAV